MFSQRIDRLLATGLAKQMRTGYGLTVCIYADADGTTSIVFPEIADDALDAFLLNYRVLTLKRDELSVRKISALIDSLDVVPTLKRKFAAAVTSLNDFLDDDELAPRGAKSHREFIDVMLHGHYAHVDPSKHSRVQT